MRCAIRAVALAAACSAGLAFPAVGSAWWPGHHHLGPAPRPGPVGGPTPAAWGHGGRGRGATLYVSHTATSGSDRDCRTAGYSSVQAAVNAAADGDTVYVCGTVPYYGPVVIEKDLTLTGDPGATIKANGTGAADQIPAQDISSSYSNLAPPQAVVAVLGDVSVAVDGLTVEGPFANDSCPTFSDVDFGILALGSSSKGANLNLDGDTITDILSSTQPDCADLGVGVLVGRYYWPTTTGGTEAVNFGGHAQISNTTVEDYQAVGVYAQGSVSTLSAQGNVVDDASVESNPNLAPSGVELARGATGEIEGNLIEHNEGRGPASGDGVGILLDGGATDTSTGGPLDIGVRISRNQLVDNDEGVNAYQANNSSGGELPSSTPTDEQIVDNTIIKNDGVTNTTPFSDYYGNTYAGYQVGITDEADSDTIAGNQIWSTDGAFGPSVTPPGPFLAPIDVQSYPDNSPVVYGNTYNGAPTRPPYAGEPGQ